MPDAVIIGGGGHARVLLDVLERLGYRLIGFSAPSPDAQRLDLPYLGRDEDLPEALDGSAVAAVLGLGKVGAHTVRLGILDRLVAAGLSFPPIVAPSATVSAHAELGPGCVVLDGAIVATGARLGRGCIVNTNASVDHDCRLDDDVHVAPGATISGAVHIGTGSMIGAGATLVHSIRVAAGVLVAAGATVVSDINEPGTWAGTPARRL